MKRTGFAGLVLLAAVFAGRALAEPFIQSVQPALFNPKSMLVQSGVAFDAHENLLGIVHIQEPKSFFKPDTKQVTWWGEFKPFKFWGKPELEAVWYEPPPPGQEVAKQNFKGQMCVLAKSTLKLSSAAKEGTWRVDIYHKGQKIDSKSFMVYGGTPTPSQSNAALTVDVPQTQASSADLRVDVQNN